MALYFLGRHNLHPVNSSYFLLLLRNLDYQILRGAKHCRARRRAIPDGPSAHDTDTAIRRASKGRTAQVIRSPHREFF